MTTTLDIVLQWLHPRGGLPGRNPVTIAYEPQPHMRHVRPTLYRIALEPLPGAHQVRHWLDWLMGEPMWSQQRLTSLRTLPAPEARTLSRSGRFCKACKRFLGWQTPMCSDCLTGTQRMGGFWDDSRLYSFKRINERSVFKLDLSPKGQRFIEISLCELEGAFVVKLTGDDDGIAALENRLSTALPPSFSLALTHEVLDHTRASLLDTKPLSHLDECLRGWSAVRLVDIKRPSEAESAVLDNENELLLVSDDCVETPGYDWRNPLTAQAHLLATLKLLGEADATSRHQRIDTRTDIEIKYLRGGGRASQVTPFVERGSTIRVVSDTAWPPELVAKLERNGMRYDRQGLGAAVSVCGVRYATKQLDELSKTHAKDSSAATAYEQEVLG